MNPGPPTPRRLAAALAGRLPHKGEPIGLLGGSFNPAHAGHLQISHEAIKRLGLSRVWWLVSPQNPLKSRQDMAPLAERVRQARLVSARAQRITVTALETLLGTSYTADTLRRLKQLFPGVRFVWLMGADNLSQVSRWESWQEIFHLHPVATLARPGYSQAASFAKAARRFARFRVKESAARRLVTLAPPAWVFLHCKLSALSATQIRAGQRPQTATEETSR